MKKTIILGLATTVMSLVSLSALAESDDPYPAANFQPKVIYLDKDSVKPSTVQCQPQKTVEKEVEFDPQYPATNFQPKVIYP